MATDFCLRPFWSNQAGSGFSSASISSPGRTVNALGYRNTRSSSPVYVNLGKGCPLLAGDPLGDLEAEAGVVLDRLAADVAFVGDHEVALDAVAAFAGLPDDLVVHAQPAVLAQPDLDPVDYLIEGLERLQRLRHRRAVVHLQRDQ